MRLGCDVAFEQRPPFPTQGVYTKLSDKAAALNLGDHGAWMKPWKGCQRFIPWQRAHALNSHERPTDAYGNLSHVCLSAKHKALGLGNFATRAGPFDPGTLSRPDVLDCVAARLSQRQSCGQPLRSVEI